MSWIERIQKGITITTGDGNSFTPLYVINSKNVEFNVAEFEFPNIGGTLVKRSEWKGTKFQLQIIFQGDDNIEKSNAGQIILEETIADNTLGKLVWIKRSTGSTYKDLLLKKPISQKHSKQEAVIQWLVNKRFYLVLPKQDR